MLTFFIKCKHFQNKILERSTILQIYQYLSILAEAAEFSSVPLHSVCWDRSLSLKYKKKNQASHKLGEVILFPLGLWRVLGLSDREMATGGR